MNTDMYIGVVFGGLFLAMVFVLVFSQRSWIKTQREALLHSHARIEQLQDRLMAKSFDQYKMYSQEPAPTPLFEMEEEFDDSAVGKVIGEEKLV